MPAGTYNLTIEQGASTPKLFIWKDSLGAPINLTGYNFRMQVRPTPTSDVVLYSASTEDGQFYLGDNLGEFYFKPNPAITSATNWKRGGYDIEAISPTGEITRLLQGPATMSLEYTRME